MRYVEVGGVKVSVIGLGAWQFGSQEWGYGEEYANRDALAITHRALDCGMNLLDTAEAYGQGRSEQIVGKALDGRRNDVFLATKITPNPPPLTTEVVTKRAQASAERLATSVLDLYQVHWPNPQIRLDDVMAGMAAVQKSGLVRHAGVSNYPLQMWKDAESALGGPVLSNQVRYSLTSREPERDLLAWAAEAGRIIIAYSPLGQGFLSGRYAPGDNPGGVRSRNPLFEQENARKAQGLLETLTEVGKAHDATPAQIALAWVVRKPNTVAIPGASSLEQVEANAAAGDIELTDAENDAITEASDAFLADAGEGLRRRPGAGALRRRMGR